MRCGTVPYQGQFLRIQVNTWVSCSRNCAICSPSQILIRCRLLLSTRCQVIASSPTRIERPSRERILTAEWRLSILVFPISDSRISVRFTLPWLRVQGWMYQQEVSRPAPQDTTMGHGIRSVSVLLVPTERALSNGTQSG